jgi:hypothetical protein
MGVCTAVFGLFAGLLHWVTPTLGTGAATLEFWPLAIVALISSLAMGMLLIIGLHTRVLQPVTDAARGSAELLQRAGMMQAAQRPALISLRDGLERHAHMLDVMRASLEEGLRSQGSGAALSGSMAGAQARARHAMREMKVDLSNQQQMARALIAANETVAARLAELEEQLRSITLAQFNADTGKGAPDIGEEDAAAAEDMSYKPLAKTSFVNGDASEAKTWPGETHQSLISEYQFKDEHTRKRFGLN